MLTWFASRWRTSSIRGRSALLRVPGSLLCDRQVWTDSEGKRESAGNFRFTGGSHVDRVGATPPQPPLAMQLFGPFEVRLNGAPLSRLRSRKGQHLLALLTLRQGAEVERAWLASLLWPDSEES